MKKRKELDALLMNGKKSRPKRSKDGHELLTNMDSESNSSELDEFVVQTRKQTTRRRKGVLCSICLRLLMFMLVVGCLTLTAAVTWMNIELKRDLDDLRKQLTDVKSMVDTSQVQSSSIVDLNKELEALPGLVTSVGVLEGSISRLNMTLIKLREDLDTLQESSASREKQENRNSEEINQNKLHIKDLKADAAANQSSLSTLINTLKTNLSTLQSQVAEMSQTQSSSQPSGETIGEEALQTLQKSLKSLDTSFDELNGTVIHLNTEVTSIRTAMAANGGPQPDGAVSLPTEDLSNLQKNVAYLMDVVNRELSLDEETDTATGGPPTDWHVQVDDRLQTLEDKVKELNPDNLNNNLLNANTSRGIQTILENTYKLFREEVHGNLTSLKTGLTGVSTNLANLELRVVALEDNTLHTTTGAASNQTTTLQGVGPAPSPTTQPKEGTVPPPGTNPETLQGGEMTTAPGNVSEVVPSPIVKANDTIEAPTVAPIVTNPVLAGAKTEAPESKTPEEGRNPDEEGPQTPEDDKTPEEGKPPEDDKEPEDEHKAPNSGNPGNSAEEPKEGESREGTTSEPELDTQLSALTGAANVSRGMRSIPTDVDIITEGLSTGASELISTADVGTTYVDVTTKKVETTRAPAPVLRIKGVTNRNALRKSFRVWDRRRDHKLTYSEFSKIPAFHGKPPPQEDFLAYDLDNDSALTQSEMAAAMHL